MVFLFIKRKIRINPIITAPKLIIITDIIFRSAFSGKKPDCRHSRENGNPWFDRLTMHPELVEGLDSRFRGNDTR